MQYGDPYRRDKRPGARGRIRAVLETLGRWLKGLIGLFLVVSVLQVAYVRFFPPPVTLTMLGRKLDAWKADKTLPLQRTWVPIDDVAETIQLAVLAGEDAFFFRHAGFDLDQIEVAFKHNLKGKSVRGASTLTQQTAKNVFLWQDRSWLRKGLEAYYTVLLELILPKRRILELYLNVAEWGDGIFGVQAASRHYFKKDASQINRTEAAALSASLPNPRKYTPTGGSRFVKRRQALILRRMGSSIEAVGGPVSKDEEEDDERPARTEKTTSSGKNRPPSARAPSAPTSRPPATPKPTPAVQAPGNEPSSDAGAAQPLPVPPPSEPTPPPAPSSPAP